MDELKQSLIDYGVSLLAGQLGQAAAGDGASAALVGDVDSRTSDRVQAARDVFGDTRARPAPGRLQSVFSLVQYPQQYDETRRLRMPQVELPRRKLSIDLTETDSDSPKSLWDAFKLELDKLEPGDGLFETFTALMARWGWYVPGTLQGAGVSVYEQFKAVAALAHVLDPDQDDVLLVAGDLPGIQDVLYTITSAGAAKALRGRSFYLQLVNDVVVRALLRDLGLPAVCVVYNAGGNFQLLARAADADRLAELRREINDRLLALHGGELFLALDWLRVPYDDLATAAFTEHAAEVGERLGAQKLRAFADLAEEEYDAIFGRIGFGGLGYCDVCHVDLEDPNRAECDQCDSLGEVIEAGELKGEYGLARKIADLDEQPWIAVRDRGELETWPSKPDWAGKPPWWRVMQAFGYEYRFGDEAASDAATHLYNVNDTDFLSRGDVRPDCAYGFRFIANTTPRIKEDDPLEWFREISRDENEQEEKDQVPELDYGDIRNTTIMARWDSNGIDRYGVLRMDIDDLGDLFTTPERFGRGDLPRRSALSAALDLFFEGWLNKLCQEAADAWKDSAGDHLADDQIGRRTKLPYVIYAGGDDLLMVGPWDVLPVVSQQVRHDLESYVMHGHVGGAPGDQPPPITVSGAIFAETAKFPLYQAARHAGRALDDAKRRLAWRTERGQRVRAPVKDAVHFLETTVSWPEFQRAKELALKVARLIDRGVEPDGSEPDRAPHALIQLLAAVAREYQKAGGDLTDERLAYGRWMPLLAYGLRRMVDRAPVGNVELREEMMALAGDTLDLTRVADAVQWHTMQFLGLPVRWAEFLIREKGE